jgi:uncharacterized membrane protein
MAHAENEITIQRPASTVYAFLADGLNNPKWRSGVQHIELKSGAAGEEGTIYSQTLTGPRGRPIQGDYQITSARPGESLEFKVIAGPARPEGRYVLTEEDGRTSVRFVLDLKLPVLMKMMDRMITKTMEGEVAQLMKLKSVLEAS